MLLFMDQMRKIYQLNLSNRLILHLSPNNFVRAFLFTNVGGFSFLFLNAQY